MMFAPMLTPKEMLQRGVFGGTYFNNSTDLKNYPHNWFKGLDETLYKSDVYLTRVNYFKVKSGQSLEEWQAKGWIHKDDPRGWFEWYCKYFMGRRHEDDERQMKRWLAFCGPKGRWRSIIYSKIDSVGCGVAMCGNVSRRIQQSLLHWSYVVNQDDYESWKHDKEVARSHSSR